MLHIKALKQEGSGVSGSGLIADCLKPSAVEVVRPRYHEDLELGGPLQLAQVYRQPT